MSKNSDHNVKIVWDEPSKEVLTYPKRDFRALNLRVKRRKRLIRMVIGALLFLVALGLLTIIPFIQGSKTASEIPVSKPFAGPALENKPFDWAVIDSIKHNEAREQKQEVTLDEPLIEKAQSQVISPPIVEKVQLENQPDPVEIIAHEAPVTADTTQSTVTTTPENKIVAAEDSSVQQPKKEFVPTEFVRAYPSVGYDSLNRYLTEYINKELLGANNEADTVRISFAIEKDGRPSGINLSISTSDSVFMRIEEVVENMPAWEPARANGEPIVTRFRLPLIIQSKTIIEE